MKRSITAFILTAVLLINCFTVTAGAARMLDVYGDVNNDYTIDSTDATLIQRRLAMIVSFDRLTEEKADFDHDGEVSPMDATLIQRCLAHIPVSEEFGGSFLPDTTIHRVYSNYASGKAMVGVPVTVTAEGVNLDADFPHTYSSFEPFEYSFEIGQGDYVRDENGNIIRDENGPQYRYDIYAQQDWSEQNSITYTFEKAGTYSVTIQLRNRCGFEDQRNAWIEVVEPYGGELPVITSVITDKGNSVGLLRHDRIQPSCNDESLTVTTLATGGSGGYEYYFELRNPGGTVIRDYSADNSFTIDKDLLPGWAEYRELKQRESEYISQQFAQGAQWVEVPHEYEYDADNYDPYDLIIKVKDSNGNETEETVKIAPIYDFDYIG